MSDKSQRRNEAGTERRTGRWPVVRFVLVFGVVAGGLLFLNYLPAFRTHVFPGYLAATAHVSSAVLRLVGEDATASGAILSSSRGTLEIARGCDGSEPIMLLLAATIALPVSWRRRATGLLAMVPILLVVNIARIVSLYYAQIHWPDRFASLHVDVWQPLFVVLTLLVWATWAFRVTARPAEVAS